MMMALKRIAGGPFTNEHVSGVRCQSSLKERSNKCDFLLYTALCWDMHKSFFDFLCSSDLFIANTLYVWYLAKKKVLSSQHQAKKKVTKLCHLSFSRISDPGVMSMPTFVIHCIVTKQILTRIIIIVGFSNEGSLKGAIISSSKSFY